MIILLYFVYIVADAMFQAYLIDEKGVWVNHKFSAAAAIVFALTANIFSAHLVFPLLLIIRWITFDFLLNMLRNKPLFYTGTITDKSSLLDTVFHNPRIMYPVKFVLLILTVYIYVSFAFFA